MKLSILLTVFLTGTWKFMFTPALALGLGFNFWESWVLSCSGAIFSSFIFYWTAEFFMTIAHKKKVRRNLEAIRTNTPRKHKKQFTRVNKLIILLKKRFGWYGITFYVPLFFSIPVGSIIVAKFYGRRNFTYPLLILGILLNGLLTTFIATLFIQ